MFKKPLKYNKTETGKKLKGPEMFKKPLNYNKMDSEYLNILGTVTEHLRSRGYDVKINNGKKKIRPRTLKGFMPDVHALNGADEIIVEILTDDPDMRKWKRFASTDGKRFWIIAPQRSVDSVRTRIEAFGVAAEVYRCNGNMKLERIL